jgi:predicted small lipoprotein YifL
MNSALRYPWVRHLLILPLFWALSACISLGPLFPPSSDAPPPPERTKPTSASQTTTGTAVNGNGPRGNGETPADGSPGSPRATYLHTVRWQGETLCLIAQWYTGSWKNWRILADANSAINPDRLAIGDRVVIPEGLLKNRKPLPRDLVLSLAAKERGQQISSHPKEARPLDLFGPKE